MAELLKAVTDILPTEVWRNWEKTGHQEFIKRSAGFLKNGENSLLIKSCVQQLIDKGIKGSLKRESVILTLQELVAIHTSASTIICDVLNYHDAFTSHIETEDAKDRSNFAYFVKECDKFLTEKPLKERLEIESLQEVGILKNKTFYSKFIKIKTKLYYKQKKFNLFREECEGFAKLKTELNKDFTADTDIKSFITNIHSLIGCFNLDPNRVLDVILESFENRTDAAHVFVPLIKSYIKDPNIIKEVLCIKLAFLKNSADQEVSDSFYILMAYLLQHGLITLNAIYPVLIPDDKVMQNDHDKGLEEANEYVRKLQVISTSSKDKEETKDEPDKTEDTFTNNQKLRLCEALLIIGDWKHAKILIDILPDHYVISYEPVASALCQLLHTIIEPVYAKKYFLGPGLQREPVKRHTNPLSPKQAYTFEDLKQDVIPMLLSLGLAIQVDSMLITKLTRLFKITLQDGTSSPLYHDIMSILDVTLFPALSYLECNCCIAEEIWTVVKNYPYQIRYCLYARWKNESYQTYPDLIKKRGDSEKQIKNIMKRVSKDNVKPIGRLLGKVTHSCPGFLFDYVLLQIQVYNNLINPVVDSLKYLTSLSYDVLGYCLIECLASADKKRVKHDSMSISAWLQSLSCFSGAVYKKYSIELTGLLQYVANQLKAQRSLDLIILKEVVQKMAGIEPNEDSTMDQLKALSGGDLLKNEAGYFSQIRNTKKSSTRLKEALGDSDLAVALCLLMSQQNYCVIYKETQKSHLKFVGMLSDHCQDTLVQFGTFLGATLSVEEYIKKFPTIQSMLLDYHIPVEVAFFLARPMLNHSINQKYDQLRKMDPNYKKMASSIKNHKYYEAVQEVMTPMYSSLLPLHSSKTWEDITPQFLATFWSLTMHDLYVPDDIYSQVIAKTKVLAEAVDNSNTKGKKEQERHLSLVDKLMDERKKQTEHVEKVLHRLKQEKDSWFLSKAGKFAKAESITRFLQLCLFPRCTFSQIDAVYCAEFVHTIHMLKTPNFSTLLCYDRLFCDVTYSIISCTEYEAFRYGRFLYAVLETVMKWHKSREVFEKECSNFPGFMTKYRVSNHTADNLDNVGYENYRHVCHKWHYKLAKAVVCCLESKDYIQIRNSLIILIKIINFFPVLIKLAQFLEKRIEQVRDEEKNNRQDLFTLAISYLGLLKQRLNGGHMMKETDFHMPVDKAGKANDTSGKDTSKQNGEAKDKPLKEEKKSNDDIKIVQMESQEKAESREEKFTFKDEKRVLNESAKKEKDNEDKTKKPIEYKEERYVEISPREERYSVERKDRFYEERSIYKEVSYIEPENERESKRRKLENSKHDDRKALIQTTESFTEKRDRSSKSSKEHREKISMEDDKEIKKERRVARKRDRLEEGSQQDVPKRRRDEDKAKLLGSGEKIDQMTVLTREKHRRKEGRDTRDSRDISPQYMAKERSHERSESREKHRRSNDNKRR